MTIFRRKSGVYMQFSRYFTFFYVISAYLIVISDGGLLSALLHAKPFYVVKLVDDFKDNGLSSEEGPVTSLLPSSSSRVGTSYSDCGSNAHINGLIVSSCDGTRKQLGAIGSDKEDADGVGSDICDVKRGSNVTFNISFVPRSNATQLKAVIHGIVDFVPIPFPCPQPDACHNSGIICPVVAGKPYDYFLSAAIKDSYPKMKLWIKGQLEDENGENVICIKIHIHIV